MHPGYTKKVKDWLNNDALEKLRHNFEKAVQTPYYLQNIVESTSVILFILHDGEGGVRHTTNDLAKHLSDKHKVFILYCNISYWTLCEQVSDKIKKLKIFLFDSDWFVMNRIDRQRQKAFDNITNTICPSLVHIRHFIGIEPEIIFKLKKYHLPVVVSIHDFYVLCPTIQLIDSNGIHCGGKCSNKKRKCNLSKKWFGNVVDVVKNNRVYEHRDRFYSQLQKADALVTTSNSSQKVLLKNKFEFKQIHIIEHGRNLKRMRLARIPEIDEKIRIVSFGALGAGKGYKLLKNLVERNYYSSENKFEFHFLGTGLGTSKSICKLGAVTHGKYSRDDLPVRINKIKPALCLILSTWPETYCHTLTEAWSMGLPVVASDIGALGERIRKHGGGWLVDYRNPAQCWAKLLEIAGDCQELLKKRQEAEHIIIKSEEDMANDYIELYQNLIPKITFGSIIEQAQGTEGKIKNTPIPDIDEVK